MYIHTFSFVVFLGHDPKRVIKAVLKHGCADPLSIGLELGFSNAQIIAATASHFTGASKLQAIIQLKMSEIGKAATAKKLLEVSRILPNPIYGRVMDELEVQ